MIVITVDYNSLIFIFINEIMNTGIFTFLHRAGEKEELTEWILLELQGDLESRMQEDMKNKFIGDMHFTKQVCDHMDFVLCYI